MRVAVFTTTLLLSLAACDAEEPATTAEGKAKGSAAKDSAAEDSADKPDEAPPEAGDGPADDVDLDAAKQAFGCDAPKGTPAKRACAGLAAFEKGKVVRSYPDEGTTLWLARHDCSKPPNDMINFLIAELSPGGGSGDEDGKQPATGEIKIRFESWVAEEGKEASADRVVADLRAGKPLSELTPAEVEMGGLPKTWSAWREKWELFAPEDIQAVQSNAASLLERSKTPAYWRESDGTLLRVAPPVRKVDWCVDQFFPVPQ